MTTRIAIAVLFLVALYTYGHHNGWAERDAEMQAEISRLNEEARTKEQKLTEQLNTQSSELKEANDVVSKKSDDLNRLINSGRVRLNSSCVQASPSTSTTSGDWNQTTSESDRETLRAIAEIAAAGDKAINQLNACIDAYNAVRETVNGQR
jgi:Tfp pilus assembly protein PilE